jgi:undecaprenyl-diphosphatase
MLLAILQGVSELFPISSLGHTVLIPALLHWNVDRSDPTFLAFVVILHFGTALALIAFYWREWIAIVAGLARSIVRGRIEDTPGERIGWLLVVGTIPVGILGALLEKTVRALFAAPIVVAIFLAINGLIMFLGERLRRTQLARGEAAKPLTALPWSGAVIVGFAQALALLPGISRSGSAIVAGLLLDLDHEDAARYSFLLATPIIGLAALLEIPVLLAPDVHLALIQSLTGGLLAAVTAYLSVAFLTKYFKHNDLRPFGWYCIAFGALSAILLGTHVL